jgi:hypothetical protein
MRCQFCQQPISLLRRLSDPEFCSAKHREAYAQQEAALAVARLQPVARQAASRTRPAPEPMTAVAVLEPPAQREATTLAGVIPCPPRQSRSYWCFALPANPMEPPVGVMLKESPPRWSSHAPAWATSVVAMWPVDRVSRRDAAALVPPAHVAFAVPVSPLRPLPWLPEKVDQVRDAITALIPLSVLPTWSLPRHRQESLTAETFPVSLRHPVEERSPAAGFAPASLVAFTPRRLPVPPATREAAETDAVQFPMAGPEVTTGALSFCGDQLALEWRGYLQRMEHQLVALAEQTGLWGRLPVPAPASRNRVVAVRTEVSAVPQGIDRCLPERSGAMPPPMVTWGGVLAVRGPVPVTLGRSLETSEAAPLLDVPGPCWPALAARPALCLPTASLGAPPPGPRLTAAVRQTPGVPDPIPATPRCWPSAPLRVLGLQFSDRMRKLPELVARQARAAMEAPEAILSKPAGPLWPAWRSAGGNTPAQTAMVPIELPGPRNQSLEAGAELHPLPAPPAVIVPVSTGTKLARSTTNQQPLFPLTHLFPGRRDQALREARLDTCPWRSKPALPPTRLPRISLQERNATRGRALKEVRQALQKQTIDRARHFWKFAPADLKWLALALPLILGVWLWPKQPVSVSVPSPVSVVKTAVKPVAGNSYLEKALQSNLNLGGFEERIANRSSIHLEEDFSAGLGLWDGDGNWARSWYYDKGGVVRPGRMAIYQPSIPMKDYHLVLTAAVERRSISWMIRASNLRNYIAIRLHIAGSGPSQRLSLERWTVKDGRVTRRQVLPLATNLGTATTAHIQMEVAGDTFTTMLQDQVVDVFTDTTHGSGGVGLFSTDGDQPRIYQLELTHQHDFFGKLCSFLAPHPITKTGTIRP